MSFGGFLFDEYPLFLDEFCPLFVYHFLFFSRVILYFFEVIDFWLVFSSDEVLVVHSS